MKTSTKYVILILALMVLAPFLSHAEESEAYRSDFSKGKMGDWEGYDAKTVVVKEETLGKYVLMSTFTDSTTHPLCNRGARVKFKDAIPWEKFDYIYFNYKVDGPARGLGYFLQDEDGNMWRLFQPVQTDEWGPSAVKKSWFEFGWGPEPTGKKESKITSLFIYIRTQEVNTGTKYTLYVDNVTLSMNLPLTSEEKQVKKGVK